MTVNANAFVAVVRETERGSTETLSIVHIHNIYGKDVYRTDQKANNYN